MRFGALILRSGLAAAAALPLGPEHAVEPRQQVAWTWNQGAASDYTLHVSCNATEQAQLRRALHETTTLAQHAKDHILRFGHSSDIYVKYFGRGSTTAEPAGWFDKLVHGDKNGVLFRCDDVDHKCWQDGWAGHWRQQLAPNQNVICPLSFEARWPLEAMCGHGFTVAEQKDSLYFGADLMHRLFHVTKIAEGVVDHFADTQEEILRLAHDHPEQAVRNSATLRHFAVEVYAYDIALPGQGCAGTLPAHSETASATLTSSAAGEAATEAHPPADAASETRPPTTTEPAPASTANSAAAECHTHADGVVHCA
ncbi:hypothetical protein PZA11_004558 [Diplocarpon coronariae]|uniref:Putative peptidase domain-containing protein n=1 Tax=Diplocarpon coronariae TaxID=2795749 RepID=A0A218ZAI7_9HELO|nr:hypothetical protein JHW43_006082 [Diplocarpon mali]OWP04176.1 hypothetical protein B2J93_385 [Marssonina coronariae]